MFLTFLPYLRVEKKKQKMGNTLRKYKNENALVISSNFMSLAACKNWDFEDKTRGSDTSILIMNCLMTKPTKWHVRPAMTQISLGIHLIRIFAVRMKKAWVPAWRKLGSLSTHWAHSEDSDQTGRMPRLIWVFAGRTVILLVLSWDGSYE